MAAGTAHPVVLPYTYISLASTLDNPSQSHCRSLPLLRLGIEKVVDHRDDRLPTVHQRDVCCIGQNSQSGLRARPQVAVNLVALEAEHFRDVIEPHAVGIAVDEEHGRFGGLELVGAEVERSQTHRPDVIYKIREFVGRRAQAFIFGFHRSSFEHFPRQCRPKVVRFLDPSVAAEPG